MYAVTENLHWFAFQVKPRHEAVCSMLLREKGYEQFLPRYRVRCRRGGHTHISEVPLFSRYVFCRCQWERRRRSQDESSILTTPGILSVVGFGGIPAPIDDDEINAIRRVVDCQLAAEPWPYLRLGEKVRILSGALKGIQGILIKEKGISHLVISLTLLQRSIAVEVDRDNVEPAMSVHDRMSAAIQAGQLG